MSVGTQLTGESGRGGGVLWAANDAFAQVMGPERREHEHGVGFELTILSRKARDILLYTMSQQPSYADN